MAISPSKEQLQALTWIERFNFRVLHALNQSPRARRFTTILGSIWGRGWVELGTSKIVWHHAFENFEKIDPNKGVLLVANHRTFYDQFVITARLFRLYGAHHNIYFPVRSHFFYTNFIGLLLNLKAAVGVMYPPIVRDKKRRHWNRYATDLMVDLLKDPATMIGFHPEGTRNRSSDPYSFLSAKPGCGELIYRSRANVIPVFLQGFPLRFWELLQRNWSRQKSKIPIVHMVMGEPMDFTDEYQLEPSMKTYLRISKKVMARIGELAEREKTIRASREKQPLGVLS